MGKLARYYIREIIKLHGVLANIVSDRDSRFTSRFWQSFLEAMGTERWTEREDDSDTRGLVESLLLRLGRFVGPVFGFSRVCL